MLFRERLQPPEAASWLFVASSFNPMLFRERLQPGHVYLATSSGFGFNPMLFRERLQLIVNDVVTEIGPFQSHALQGTAATSYTTTFFMGDFVSIPCSSGNGCNFVNQAFLDAEACFNPMLFRERLQLEMDDRGKHLLSRFNPMLFRERLQPLEIIRGFMTSELFQSHALQGTAATFV